MTKDVLRRETRVVGDKLEKPNLCFEGVWMEVVIHSAHEVVLRVFQIFTTLSKVHRLQLVFPGAGFVQVVLDVLFQRPLKSRSTMIILSIQTKLNAQSKVLHQHVEEDQDIGVVDVEFGDLVLNVFLLCVVKQSDERQHRIRWHPVQLEQKANRATFVQFVQQLRADKKVEYAGFGFWIEAKAEIRVLFVP